MPQSSRPPRSTALTAILVAVSLLVGIYIGFSLAPGGTTPEQGNSDSVLQHLFDTQASDVQVSGTGRVSRILADDNEGSRHQKFILELASGQTLLVAHNIDLAPRLDDLRVGDEVTFFGEYVYSEQGGTIHWTHHDPAGRHVAGWLEWKGRTYG